MLETSTREESFSRGEFLVWMMIDRGGWNDGSKVEGVVAPKEIDNERVGEIGKGKIFSSFRRFYC